MMCPLRRASFLIALGLLLANGDARAAGTEFSRWLDGVASEARARGISEATLATALRGLEPIPEVIERDRNQPELTRSFCEYIDRRLSPRRIERGRELAREHRVLLDPITAEYGVPARFIIALWGLETNYGDYLGDFPVVGALATLAHDPRRSAFFRRQLLAALQIVDEGHREPDAMLGSWAGAMGQVQLMPTSFLEYAVDQDGDGRKDVWESLPDAFATAANYLRRAGWRGGQTWGRQVQVPAKLGREGLRQKRSLRDWQRRGVRRVDGRDLPVSRMRGSIVLPERKRSPAFLVYRNYRSIMAWNPSSFYAISVGALADAIPSGAPGASCAPARS